MLNTRRPVRRVAFILLTLLLILPVPAMGFTPDLKSVEQALEKEYQALDSWEVDLRSITYPQYMIRIWQDGQKWRQDWMRIHEQETLRGRIFLTALGNGPRLLFSFPDYESVPVPLLDIWIPSFPWWWERFGIDTEIRSFQFFKDRPALVVGGQYGEYYKPQLWIDNERMVPLRLLTAELELQWYEYKKVGNFWLPQKIQVLFPDRDGVEFSLGWRSVNAPFEPDRFNVEAFRALFSSYIFPKYIPSEFRSVFERFPQATSGSPLRP